MFTDADLDDFIADQTRKDSPVSIRRDARSPYWTVQLSDRRSSLLRLDQSHDPARSRKGRGAEREKAKRRIEQARAAATSLRLDDIAGRYWQEVGQHHAGADNTERQIGYLIGHFGKDKPITDITDDDVTKLVAWRRGHRTRGGALISPFTVNDPPSN